MKYFNSEAKCELLQLYELAISLEDFISDEITPDHVTNALKNTYDIVKARITEYFKDIEPSDDGVKRLTIKDGIVSTHNKYECKFAYHCTGLFEYDDTHDDTRNNNHFVYPANRIILEPFDFKFEDPTVNADNCDFNLLFKASDRTLDRHMRQINNRYFYAKNYDNLNNIMPESISQLIYNYMLTRAGLDKKPTSVNLVKFVNDLKKFKEFVTNNNINIDSFKTQLAELTAEHQNIEEQHKKYRQEIKTVPYSDSRYADISKNINTTSKQLDNISSKIKNIRNLLQKEIRLCIEYEKKLVYILSYIADSKMARTLFSTYKKWSHAKNISMLPILYEHEFYDTTKSPIITFVTKYNPYLYHSVMQYKDPNKSCCYCTIDDIICPDPNIVKTVRRYHEDYGTPPNSTREYAKTTLAYCAAVEIPDIHVPFISTDDIDKLIDIYKTEYANAEAKLNSTYTLKDKKEKLNNKCNEEVAFIANMCVLDALEKTAIKHADKNNIINKLLFNPIDATDEYSTKTIYQLKLCEESNLYYPYDDDNHVHNVETSLNVKIFIDRYHNVHEHVVKTVDKMLEYTDIIQNILSNIDDEEFKNYLIKAKLIKK